MTITNRERAQWADKALTTFRHVTGCDHEDSLGDLLGDLMHWADRNNFDFEAALIRAQGHYQAECAEEAGPAAGDLLTALEQAVQALNTAPRFKVPHLDTDSYAIASICDRAIAKAKGGGS